MDFTNNSVKNDTNLRERRLALPAVHSMFNADLLVREVPEKRTGSGASLGTARLRGAK